MLKTFFYSGEPLKIQLWPSLKTLPLITSTGHPSPKEKDKRSF
jgi:hypothetical protein